MNIINQSNSNPMKKSTLYGCLTSEERKKIARDFHSCKLYCQCLVYMSGKVVCFDIQESLIPRTGIIFNNNEKNKRNQKKYMLRKGQKANQATCNHHIKNKETILNDL